VIVLSKVSTVSKVSKEKVLKASIPLLYVHSNEYSNRYYAAFAAGSVHLKKPSGGPKGLIGPPCHGAPWTPRQKLFIKEVI
jgi:hypothetical protein